MDLKSAGRAYAIFLRYAVGGTLIVVGLSVLFGGQPQYIRPFGAFLGIAGGLLLPETSRWLAHRWPRLSAWYLTPLMAGGVLLIGFASLVAGGMALNMASGQSHPELVAKGSSNGSHSGAEIAKVVEQAQAQIATGADLNALKIIAQGTDATERQNDPAVLGLLTAIRANLTKNFGPKDADAMIREGLLPPTPKNLGRNEMLAQARSALHDGLPDRGLAIIYDNATPEMLQADPETKALVGQIEARLKDAEASSRGGDFADQVRTYWLPQVNGIPTTPPGSAAEIWNPVAKLEDAVRALEGGSAGTPNAGDQKARRDLRNAIAAKQRNLFPVLRGAYGKIVGQVMWENDLDIRVGGTANRTITWIGGLFAARANIARGQEQAQPHLLKLRFKHSTYEWARGIGEQYTYTMDAPADDVVGYWQGGSFKLVR